MARAPTPTLAWVQEQVILFFAARFPQQSIGPDRELRDLGFDRLEELAELARALNVWQPLAVRGLLLTPSATSAARTIKDVVRVVLRGLSAPPAPSRPTPLGRPARKKRVSKPAKRPARKAAKKQAKKPAKKQAKKRVPKRTVRRIPYFPPGVDPYDFGDSFRSSASSGVRLSRKSSSARGRARPPKKAAAKRTVRARLAPVRERARPKRTVRARPPVRRMKAASAREPRYANAGLYEAGAERRLDAAKSLNPGQIVRLRLDIGELSSDSQVINPKAIDDKLPPVDLDLGVMVSSTDFIVATEEESLGTAPTSDKGSVAHGRFFLPGDGRAATTRDGKTHAFFFLKLPQGTKPGTAYARIGYYYKNVLVQSQQLTAHVSGSGGFQFVTDYTLSADLTGLEVLPRKPRISIFTNANGSGGHQIVLRRPGQPPSDQDKGGTIHISDGVDATIEKLRKKLTMLAPGEKLRSKYQLIEDLREIVPIGRSLYSQLPGKLQPEIFQELRKNPESLVVQVARPTNSSFVLPWAFLYDIPLSDNTKPTICPTVENWNGSANLFKGSPRQCPSGPHKPNVLCPFGFWGVRYAVEQVSRTERPALEVSVGPGAAFVAGEARHGVDLDELDAHIGRLRKTVGEALPQTSFSEGKDYDTLQKLLGQDLPFVYFFCHGQTVNVADRNTWLSVGNEQKITADEFIGWTQTWSDEGKRVWDKIRPLVFMNACHSLEIASTTLVSYLDAFVGNARAAGVIGTEVKVEQKQAMELAEQFFKAWLNGATVESALREIRMDFLRQGNLFGLVYTPYCWSELKVVKQGGG